MSSNILLIDFPNTHIEFKYRSKGRQIYEQNGKTDRFAISKDEISYLYGTSCHTGEDNGTGYQYIIYTKASCDIDQIHVIFLDNKPDPEFEKRISL